MKCFHFCRGTGGNPMRPLDTNTLFAGTIFKKTATYFCVRPDDWNKTIFTHKDDCADIPFDEVQVGDHVVFRLAQLKKYPGALIGTGVRFDGDFVRSPDAK